MPVSEAFHNLLLLVEEQSPGGGPEEETGQRSRTGPCSRLQEEKRRSRGEEETAGEKRSHFCDSGSEVSRCVSVVTRAGGRAEGAVHPPALAVDAAAAPEGDAGAQQEALTQQVRGDPLPADRQASVCRQRPSADGRGQRSGVGVTHPRPAGRS